MTRTSVCVCRDPRGLQWQLGPLPPVAGRLTLIGWRQAVEPIDDGVPEEVARVLAGALVSVARVTFASSSSGPAATNGWSQRGGDLIRTLTRKGIGGRVVAKLTGAPPDIGLTSTKRPETVVRMFDEAAFPWWMQGQLALLSEPDAPPPDIDEPTLLALFEDEWTKEAASLARIGVQGIVRPGVDGDVAGLLSLSEGFEQGTLDALERETRLAGFDWSVLPEATFPGR